MINLDDNSDDEEESPDFYNIIADGKRKWEVVKIYPIKGTLSVYECIHNIDIDWSKVNSVCFYLRLCVHCQALAYFIPYLFLLD